MKKEIMVKYAQLIVKRGINIQEGQMVSINAPLYNPEFVRILTEECYKCGAKEVVINWNDEKINSIKYKYISEDILKELPEYVSLKAKYQFDNNTCRISITSPDPDGENNIDFKKLKIAMEASKPIKKYTSDPYMESKLQWTVVAIPNEKWALKVFPNLSADEAMEKLWEAILSACYVEDNLDSIKEWEKHDNDLLNRCNLLNKYNFKELSFKSSNGTDFTLGLVKNHIWQGGCEKGKTLDVFFDPNLPTEEIFTMPNKFTANGKVVSTKPLMFRGVLIENFGFIFENGKVVQRFAEKGLEALDSLLETDEGSRMLGEVALVPYDSPISSMNILFYNTLFDENASCHLALGNSYTSNMQGADEMGKEELLSKGYNESLNHVDFMIGTSDMLVVGTTYDNKEVMIFKDGKFVI